MKKSVYLICMAILGVSCTSDNYVPEENNVSDEEYVTMSFGYSGELVNVTTSSMTKVTKSGSSDDLFLFTLYEVNGENTNEHTYGYLVSDDPESCSMSFLKNRTYICQALCIPNGKTLIAKKPNGNYDYPFVEMGPYAGRSYKLNEPFYGDFAFDQGFLGFCMPSDLNEEIGNEIQWYDYYYNPVDIYYGAMFFNPEKNTNIVIDFYRMMFSVSLNITNFQSGKIRLLNKYEIHPSD
ncbi:MAG: hypothetical protein IK006_07260, partial [Bacteroidaceae bacterium]|nr:hypothetical protein [Bacteroidaceae bacterium]